MYHLNRRLIIPTAVIAMLLGLLQPSQAQWVQTNGPSGGAIGHLCVSGTTIFAAASGKVYRSNNNGSSWTAVNTGFSNLGIYSFAVNGNTIFIGTSKGLLRSNNNGESWTTTDSNFDVSSVVVCGTSIFAVTNYDSKLRCSVDDAHSWVVLDLGLSNLLIYTLAVIGNDIFAGTNHGVYRSTNKGKSWTAADSGLFGATVGSFIAKGSFLFANTHSGIIFRSVNNGASWTEINSINTNRNPNSIIASGNNLFICTDTGGVFRSIDNGDNWTAVNKGLYDKSIFCFAVLGTDIFVGTFSGVFLSTNNGDNWTAVNSGINEMSIISPIIANGNTIIVRGNSSDFLSTNKGIDWQKINYGVENIRIRSFAVSGNDFFYTSNDGIFHSTNKGADWTTITDVSNTKNNFFSIAVNGDNILTGTDSNGVFLSTNKGVSWRNIDSGFSKVPYPRLAMSGNSILVAGDRGIFQFTDTGWVSFGLKGMYINSIVISGNTIIAHSSDDIFQYSDTGWTSIAFGLRNLTITDLAVKDKNIFAVTRNNSVFSVYSVFQFMNTGWRAVNSGLSNSIIYSLAIDDDNYIYAGTNNGVWRCPIAEITKTKDFSVPQTSNQTTLKIHAPSASSTMLSIEYSLKSPQRVHFTICNLSGRVIQTRSEEFSGSGTHRLLFDNRSLAPGCYNLQMHTDTFTENKLFTISR